MTWRVRTPAAEDADAVATINVRGWQHAYANIVPTAILDALQIEPCAQRLRERFANRELASGFVAVDDRGVLGGYCWFGDLRPDPDVLSDDPSWGEIYAIYVDPAHIGTGAGAALMVATLAALGARPVTLWVFEANAQARAFYEKFGFTPSGVHGTYDADGTSIPELRYLKTPVADLSVGPATSPSIG